MSTFVYGTGISSPDYMVRGAETFALIRDHIGSVRFVLNTVDNAIAQELRYDPFGKVILDTNPGFQPFGYAGGLYDPDTELTRFGARDYDAHTGRWTARDPIAFGGGQTNLYVYVGNDPINFVDPNGTAYGRHGKELGLPNWQQTRGEDLRKRANAVIGHIRKNAQETVVEPWPYGIKGSGKAGTMIDATVHIWTNPQNSIRYYVTETAAGGFVGAGVRK